MTRFKFAQTDWKIFLVYGSIPIIYRVLHMYFAPAWAMPIAAGIGVILIAWSWRFFDSVVKFTDTLLLFNGTGFSKELQVNYQEISRVTYTNNRFKDLSIYTAGTKIKIPSPARPDKGEELLKWLRTKNPAMEVEIINDKK